MTRPAGTGTAGRAAACVDPGALLRVASGLVAAAGENPGGSEEATVEALAAEAARLGLEARRRTVAPGRDNIAITLPADDGAAPAPGLLFLGHSDVVPAGLGWSMDPYAPVVRDGRLYGRGSTDMKGGLAAVLAALAALKESGLPRTAPVTLLCTVDEEDLGTGIRAVVADGLPGEYAACVVAEPTDLDTVTACRGDAYLEIEVTGRAAHSGRPSDGRSAINAAGRIIDLLRSDEDRLALDPDPVLGHGTWNVGTIHGGIGTSTVAPSCHLSVDRRLLPGEDAEAIRDALARRISEAGIDGDGIAVDLELTMQMPGFRTDPGHALVASAVDAVAAAGGASRTTAWTAACDGGFVADRFGVPTIVLGPGGINDQAHQPDESVGVDELETAARAFAVLAELYACRR